MFCSIIPDHMLRHLARHPDPRVHGPALRSLSLSAKHRQMRASAAAHPKHRHQPFAIGGKQRYVCDCRNTGRLPGRLIRQENGSPSQDATINQAYDDAGIVYDFYAQAYQRDSIDGRGMPMVSSIHYGTNYDNAFWSGTEMIYGDGDGIIFGSFTSCLDIPGHEISHGVTQHTSNLLYEQQPGALNESFSDCMGSCVKQFHLGQTADQADWLIGQGLLAKGINGIALRSMKAPGTAYDDPQLGQDPQPDSMAKYVQTFEDEGGVHINSGIPNKAFYLAATGIGGKSWEGAGKIWYQTNLTVRATCDFLTWAQTTCEIGKTMGASIESILQAAWKTVGIEV